MAHLYPESLDAQYDLPFKRVPGEDPITTIGRLAKEALQYWVDYFREENPGDLVGEVIRWPRGDGYAQYMVVKQRPLTLAHIYQGDAWMVERALIRGMRVSDVRKMVENEKAIREIFSKRNP